MPINADLLLDTSVAVPLILQSHAAHTVAMRETDGLMLGLAGHAAIETYAVLTRLPGKSRVPADVAAQAIVSNFPASVTFSNIGPVEAVATLAEAGVSGGAVYDGLVGLAAREAGVPLISLDRRAALTYARLGVNVRLL